MPSDDEDVVVDERKQQRNKDILDYRQTQKRRGVTMRDQQKRRKNHQREFGEMKLSLVVVLLVVIVTPVHPDRHRVSLLEGQRAGKAGDLGQVVLQQPD